MAMHGYCHERMDSPGSAGKHECDSSKNRGDDRERYYSTPFIRIPWKYRITREDYSYNDELTGFSDYYYNGEGLLEKKEFIRSDGFKTITFFNYQQDGKLKTSERILPGGRKMVFTYTYDESGHLVQRISVIGDSIAATESYLYNADGQLAEAFYKNVDGWLSGRLKFTSAPGNRIASGTFRDENGNQADIRFTYDPAGLLTGIRWLFRNGTFQVYSFRYN
jgi:YD repeat-containing protein